MREKAAICLLARICAALRFFPYHKYTNEPRNFYNYSNVIRKWPDEKGFANTELILNEWHNGGFYVSLEKDEGQ